MINGKKIIEIRKAGFVNKGAELMLYAILEKIQGRYPDAKITIAPTPLDKNRPYPELAKLGVFPKASLWRYGLQWGGLARLLPRKLREMYGVILDSEVDVVIDAAGFSYGDQWGIGSTKELANASRRWKAQKTKLILMPQALGPYRNTRIVNYIKDIARNADLIFAREKESYANLVDVVGADEHICVAPDFTNLIQGELPEGYDSHDKKVAIIPNYRMVDKTTEDISNEYFNFLVRCVSYLLKKKAKPFMLVHEGKLDLELAQRVSTTVGGIPIVTENNPLKIKGIIGTCNATVGSRFHGLVSALSQGVPSLGTGWSHKYSRLFEDYDFEEGLISVSVSDDELYCKIDTVIGSDSKCVREKLIKRSIMNKEISNLMWDKVFGVIDEV